MSAWSIVIGMEVKLRRDFMLVPWVCAVLILTLHGCTDPTGGASGVPCVTVSEWDGVLSFRLHDEGILVTVQTDADLRADGADGGINYIPHSAVYRFDAATEEFSAVADNLWDESTEPATLCCLLVLMEGNFGQDGGVLRFGNDAVEVAGGTLVKMSPSPTRRFLAALSTNGSVGAFSVSTGQHFHQVYSIDTGEQIGAALRIANGGQGAGTVAFDWTEDERFVVYRNSIVPNSDAGIRVCVVDRERHGG